MAEDPKPSDQVVAFLNELIFETRYGEAFENELLSKIIEIAKNRDHIFTAQDFKDTVKLKVAYTFLLVKWPFGHA